MRKAVFHLTRTAALGLRDIHARSVRQWGEKTADKYIAALYGAMAKAAAKPDTGKLRTRRAVPFLMLPAGKHFIVYDRFKSDIVVLAVLHQRRDIERIIADMTPIFLAEIEALRARLKANAIKQS